MLIVSIKNSLLINVGHIYFKKYVYSNILKIKDSKFYI